MEGDYSRDTFDPFKRFSQVLMQQGRVQLDADWNEQGSILLHYLRTLAVDLIGQHGGPADALGFEIAPGNETTSSRINDLTIGPGHYYVDGILCENEGTTARKRSSAEVSVSGTAAEMSVLGDDMERIVLAAEEIRSPIEPRPGTPFTGSKLPISYYDQADYPLDPRNNQRDRLPEGALFVYLDVWERHLTYLEDDSIREVALGGPDTSARARIVWQVKVRQLEKLTDSLTPPIEARDVTCGSRGLEAVMRALKDQLQPANRGLMAARAQVPEDTETDVCIVSPEASYRGLDNQNYRVQIHRGGGSWDGSDHDKDTAATFKWSRDAVAFAIQSLSGRTVTLENLGRDDRFGLEVGDWVEVVDDDYVLLGKAEPLLRVEKIDRIEMRVTLSGAPKYGHDPRKHPLLRRWDQQKGDPAIAGLQLASDGAALIVGSGAWLNLEDGVQVQFTGGTYRTGDYWSIPARTATGDIVWPGPVDKRPALPPRGVEHHYAPLACVFPEDGRGYRVNDLRHSIAPIGSCCPKIEILNLPTWMRPAAADASRLRPIQFAVRVSGRNTDLKYRWSIVGGTITGADNTPSITVAPADDKTTMVIAVVMIEGLPEDCPNSAMAACAIVNEPS